METDRFHVWEIIHNVQLLDFIILLNARALADGVWNAYLIDVPRNKNEGNRLKSEEGHLLKAESWELFYITFIGGLEFDQEPDIDIPYSISRRKLKEFHSQESGISPLKLKLSSSLSLYLKPE